MADDKSKTGSQDRQRISLSDRHVIRDRSKKCGVMAEELKAATEAVGNDAATVGAHLKGMKR